MVGMVANLDNYDEEELRALEQAIQTRRDELDDDVPPSTKQILYFVHDLILSADPEAEGYAGMGMFVRSKFCHVPEGSACSGVADFETQTGHKFRIEVHNID